VRNNLFGHRSPRRRPSRRSHAAVVIVFAALLLARPGAQGGTSEQEPPAPQPTFRIEANFVRVDVYPTIGGKPVRDLRPEDFEILEDGRPQQIETFEHVEIRAMTPQDERREPNTVAEARSMAEDPRSRVFVVFLDTYHTDIEGSHRIRRPLIDMLERIIGPDDLVGFMTPEMSAKDVTLARRTETIEGMLSRYWYWGRRDRLISPDPVEVMYETCYPEPTAVLDRPYGGVASEMMQRRREKQTIDALADLSVYLQGVREERKAVVAVTNGWLLYRPDLRLARLGANERPPSGGTVGVGPDGRITTDRAAARTLGGYSREQCEIDRVMLSQIDNWTSFYDLLDRANRANVSFYPIDSRGLAAIDQSLGAGPVLPLEVDRARLRTRLEHLRALADATDGLAIVDSNDLQRGVRRIVDDLTSYYLLGYYSTNTNLDGKTRSLKVRVKRPGVDVRARRGYRPATAEEITAARELTTATEAAAPPSAFQAAIASLAGVRADTRFLTHVSWVAAPIHDELAGAKGHVWVTGELDSATVRADGWAAGAEAEILLTAEDGVRLVDETRTVTAPVRYLTLDLPDVALGPGDYALRVRLRPAGDGLPFMDTIRFTVPENPPATGQPRLLRRGQVTGNRFVATADPRFRRTEWLRVEVPMHGAPEAVSAELLDRAGNPIPVPVTTQPAREDAEGGLTWAAADVSLAPLAPGDYAVRTTITRGATREELITAFRIVP
jgi:VWFA-related protein